MKDSEVATAVEVLTECFRNNEDNVELLEQICFALNAYVTTNGMIYVSLVYCMKISKSAKIMYRYNQVPYPTQDTNGKVTNSQIDTTNESQDVSPFPAGDHKAQINRSRTWE